MADIRIVWSPELMAGDWMLDADGGLDASLFSAGDDAGADGRFERRRRQPGSRGSSL